MLKETFGIRHRISTKFLAWFMVVALPPLLALSYITLYTSTKAVKDEVVRNLVEIRELKVQEIQEYVLRAERDITLLSHTPLVIVAMEQLGAVFVESGADSSDYAAADANFRSFLS